jgi:serine/threonine protein kinase
MLHRRHLSHRNLSPETILMQNGHAILQDVGLAARMFEPGEGPLLYQAPEQVRLTRNLDVPGPHTDIYQLGMILYHILTGRLPLSPLPDVPPVDWNNAITQDLYVVIRRALAPAAKDRWPTIRAFSNAIRDTIK